MSRFHELSMRSITLKSADTEKLDPIVHVGRMEHGAFVDLAQNDDGGWGETHRDYRTSEYEHGTDVETGTDWEQCRGIGLSFFARWTA